MIRRPSYYKDFKCIASACKDSCCAGWEIDIDEETYEFYENVKGEFGDRLRANICPPSDETDEPAHFISAPDERCPFLNEQGLCDIFTELGEEHLSYICTHHPRYYEWMIGVTEAGLGIACEEACRIILQKTGYPEFDEEPEIGDCQESELTSGDEQDDMEYEAEIEEALFEMRSRIFGFIKSGDDRSLYDIVNDVFAGSADMQEELDNLLYPDMEIVEEYGEGFGEASGSENDEDASDYDEPKFSDWFYTEETLGRLADFFLELEINSPEWWAVLKKIKENIPEILARKVAFDTYYNDRNYEYEQLLIYFIYRYFMKCREDGALRERVMFALLSTCMIHIIDIWTWMKNGEISPEKQIDICKMYSVEIEYDEGNVIKVSEFV